VHGDLHPLIVLDTFHPLQRTCADGAVRGPVRHDEVQGRRHPPNDTVRAVSAAVEVCFVSYGSASVLVDAVASVGRTMPGATVAVQEHAANAAETLRASLDASGVPYRLLVDESNPGFAAGCNALAAASTAEWLLFLNPDAQVVTWPWVGEQSPPRGEVIGPEMVGSGHPGRHYGVTYSILDEVRRSWLRQPGRRPVGRGFVSGAALLIDRVSFERVGGFDERYFMFYEDIDFCVRANQAGVPTFIADEWTVRHAGAHSTSSRFGQSLQWSFDSGLRFHKGAGEPLWLYRMYVAADAALRWLHAVAGRNTRRREAYGALARRALRR
jgi:N-acetylglucosaminyl-diphospho-decaprenol L-rhamnosyltransferase